MHACTSQVAASKFVKVALQFFSSHLCSARCCGFKVTGLDSGLSGPGSSPGWGQHVVFLGKTLSSVAFHSASLY